MDARPDDQRFNLDEGRVYTVAGPEQAHPTLVWRQGCLLHYLVGDSFEWVQAAGNHLRLGS